MNKQNLIIGVLVVLVVVLVGVNIYLVQKPSVQPTQTTPTATTSPVVTTTPTKTDTPTPTTVDEIADWKTYKVDSLGFSFRYPSTYKIIKEEGIGLKVKNRHIGFVDSSRKGNPTINFLFNPDGVGGGMAADTFYCTVVNNGKVKIADREDLTKNPLSQKLKKGLGEENRKIIIFDVRYKIYQAEKAGENRVGFIATFSYDKGSDYSQELEEIINFMRVTEKANIFISGDTSCN
jgi:hypothetical protein